MAKDVITLYCCDTSLRLLVARGKQVKKWADLPLEPGIVSSGVVFDKPKLAAKIKELLQDQGVKAKKVIAGLSGLHCVSRVITLPQVPKAMLAEAIRREAERDLPVPLEQFYLSWQITHATKEEIQVFLAAFPRNAADSLIETLHLAGIKPYLMDLAPLALTRVAKESTAITVDVQPTMVDIVVMVEGIPQIIRSLPLSQGDLSPQERLPTIREELDRTIKFYDSNHPQKPLELTTPIYISGELWQEPEAFKYLAEELKYSVLPMSSPLKCPEGFDPNQYSINIGLALKEGKGKAGLSVVNLNALPEVYQTKPLSLTKVIIAPGVTVLAISLLIPLIMLLQSRTANTTSLQAQIVASDKFLEQKLRQQQLAKKEITEQEKKVAELEKAYNALTAKLNSFTTVLGNFGSQQRTVNRDLWAPTYAIPENIHLKRIAHAGTTLTIEGTAPSESEVSAYASSLRDSGYFSQVSITNIEKTESGMKFTLALLSGEQSRPGPSK